MFGSGLGCGCQSPAELAMQEEMRRFPGSYNQFAAARHSAPAPQAIRTEGMMPHATLTGTVQTNARQLVVPGDVASPPQRAEQGPVALIPAIRGSAVNVARSGIALMMGTVFHKAVQYVRPAAPNTAPVLTYATLRINDLLDPEHRALEMPRYHFAVIDSQAMLNEAKKAAMMRLQTGQPAGGP